MTDIILKSGEHALSVGIANRDVLSYDVTGRPLTLFLDGTTYKRGLDNRVLMIRRKWTGERRIKSRRFLGEEEVEALFRRSREVMNHVRDRFAEGSAAMILPKGHTGPLRETIRAWIDRITLLTPSELVEDRRRFLGTYRPIGILPPDQYLSVVLQGTEGCSYNRCIFCNFYRTIHFRIKSPDEFRRHIRNVQTFFGPAIGLRKTIFLADANALVIPQHRLLPMMMAIADAFPLDGPEHGRHEGRPRDESRPVFRGVHSFIDSFSGPMKEVEDFVELRELSLRRLYLGLETGSDALLRFLEKPGTARDALTLIRRIKKAGIRVGVIVMAGLGGHRFAKEHVEDTIALLRAMRLGKDDILYISDFEDQPETEYGERSAAEGIRDLDPDQILAQRKAFAASLIPEVREKGLKIAPYNIRDFIY
jgi:hypothetical protein